MNSTGISNGRIGWKGQPDGRGTLDIVWTCVLSMFLCSWSILCMNAPGPKESKWQILWRKIALTGLGVMCPEMIFAFAYSQWLQARQSVQDMNSISPAIQAILHDSDKPSRTARLLEPLKWLVEEDKRNRWSMKEAFFAEMGGFRLRTRDYPVFPLDAKQIYLLVSKGYIDPPELDRKEIEDKNKADGLLRAITLSQISWFSINVVGRWAQKLTVTTFELTTISSILCSCATAFCWWRKPADVYLPKIIDCDIEISEVLRRENQPDSCMTGRTPLDFMSREDFWWSKCWCNMTNILRHMNITFGSDSRPIDRIDESHQKALTRKQQWFTGCLGYIFFAVFFVGWRHDFPTHIEQTLWRVATLGLIVTTTMLVICLEVQTLWLKFSASLQAKMQRARDIRCPKKMGAVKKRFEGLDRWMDRVRNNSPNQDPELYVPLKLIIPVYVTGAAYCCSRMYILTADVIELRSLPSNAFSTVEWQKFWPRLH